MSSMNYNNHHDDDDDFEDILSKLPKIRTTIIAVTVDHSPNNTCNLRKSCDILPEHNIFHMDIEDR